jgi:nicotinamide-nucleotide amidase
MSEAQISDARVAEIVMIGDELNRGEIVDTNSVFLGERLTDLGLYVRFRTSVTDDPADMLEVLKEAARRADVVVVTGGLGPTEDDRTVDVACWLLGVEPTTEPTHEARLRARAAARNFRLVPNFLRQARVPSGATVLPNSVGMAPGFAVDFERARLFFMPGVPHEMKPMFEGSVMPAVRTLADGAAMTVRRSLRVMGLGESHVDHALIGLLDGVELATLHYRIVFPEVLVTIVVRRRSEEEAAALVDRLETEAHKRLGDHCYGRGETSLSEVVGTALRSRGATLSVAESCTGGLLGELLTAVPGSSDYFLGGVIAYADAIKVRHLGVKRETLTEFGAVSEQTARQMAVGVRQAFDTTYGIAITGVAGPGGGTAEKPIGTVHLALSGPNLDEHRRLFWPAPRDQVRAVSAYSSLHLLYRLLTD